MTVQDGSRFLREIATRSNSIETRSAGAPRFASSRFVRETAGSQDPASAARLSQIMRLLGQTIRNNEGTTDSSSAESATTTQHVPSPLPNAKLHAHTSAHPKSLSQLASATKAHETESETAAKGLAFEKLMRPKPAKTQDMHRSLEVRLPSATARPGQPRNAFSIEFGPEMDELFDQVWVKVQRRLSQPSESLDIDPAMEEIRHHNIQSMVVTSWSQGEGCSTMALGLAARSAASAQGQVCLVDADFHSTGLTRSAGLESHDGLAELLNNSGNLEDLLVEGPTPNLYFLPAGQSRGPESLAVDAKMQMLIRSLEERFRYVFFDTSCLKRGVEAYRWGRFILNTILVVRAGRTRKQTILHAVDSLHLHGMRLLGTILNHRANTIPNWLYPYV